MAGVAYTQPWIYSRRVDLCFIIGPAFVITILMLVLQISFPQWQHMPPWLWLLLIVGVDVTHVYSTIFRTYCDREQLRQHRTLFTLIPLFAWIAGCLLYSVDKMLFWRVLAYLAVFHFVRQQYGFMMIYGRKENLQYKWLDKLAIYGATLYPIIYWHCHQRQFDWFIAGDFAKLDSTWLSDVAWWLYLVILCGYAYKEWRMPHFNWPRNLMLLGTLLSWYIGIVWFNNDLAFSAINVIAHGIPYLALIWIYGRNQDTLQQSQHSYYFHWIPQLFQPRKIYFFLAILGGWAYIEECLWDGWIWREHGQILLFAQGLSEVSHPATLTWLVPLLAMPQVTHYLLDAYIWRMKQPDTNWKTILFLHSK